MVESASDAAGTRRTLSEAEMRVATRRVAAVVRINAEARVCPACLAIDLHLPLTIIVAAVHRLLGSAGVRLTSDVACARCGAHTPAVSFVSSRICRGTA